MRRSISTVLGIALAVSLALVAAGPTAAATDDIDPQTKDPVVCDADADHSDGDAHAWCGANTDCYPVVWGVEIGPVFVGGYYSCQAGVWYDESGSSGPDWIDL